MIALGDQDRPVHVRIGRISVSAGSALEARRLCDALPNAIEGALTGQPSRPHNRADKIAAEIVARIRGASQ
jgi:hypothetical protein